MAIHIVKCLRCDHEWATKLDKPRLCPKCKNAYWDLPAKAEVFMKGEISCPLCPDREFSSFLNLARHMVLSDRHDGPHQMWLQSFLSRKFEHYAFGKDKAIGLRLKAYRDNHESWPDIDVIG